MSTQLRGADVIQQDRIHAMRLTPDAGTIKNGAVRIIPIHEHLVAQDFLDFVRSKGSGPLVGCWLGQKRTGGLRRVTAGHVAPGGSPLPGASDN